MNCFYMRAPPHCGNCGVRNRTRKRDAAEIEGRSLGDHHFVIVVLEKVTSKRARRVPGVARSNMIHAVVSEHVIKAAAENRTLEG
jgi:hypothetical protein